jgi:hypothetical protein
VVFSTIKQLERKPNATQTHELCFEYQGNHHHGRQRSQEALAAGLVKSHVRATLDEVIGLLEELRG